jgi:hypothetical protein
MMGKKGLMILAVWMVLCCPVLLAAQPVPDTGVTQCYDDEDEIPCPTPGQPFYGQDANYTINPPSYAKLDSNGNDLPVSATSWVMVRDNVTGLIWEVKTDDGGLHDKDNAYDWYEAEDDFIAALNSAHFGGYSDWRIPTIKELAYLVDYSIPLPGPTINTTYFPNTVSSLYWSSTTHAYDTDDAWGVDFYDGYDCWSYKSLGGYVRAVRGGQ